MSGSVHLKYSSFSEVTMRSFSISIRLLASVAVALTLLVGEAAYAQTDWAVV